jgi:hypothetical protein
MFKRPPVRGSDKDRIDNRGVSPTKDEPGTLPERRIHSVSDPGRVAVRTKAFERRHTAYLLPDLVAPKHDRARYRANERRERARER